MVLPLSSSVSFLHYRIDVDLQGMYHDFSVKTILTFIFFKVVELIAHALLELLYVRNTVLQTV